MRTYTIFASYKNGIMKNQTQTIDLKKTIALYESPKKEQNEENFGVFGQECICCGKPMVAGMCKWVHMNEAWEVVHPSITTDYDGDCLKYTGSNSQGHYPVGNECAKKMSGYTFDNMLDKSHPYFKK